MIYILRPKTNYAREMIDKHGEKWEFIQMKTQTYFKKDVTFVEFKSILTGEIRQVTIPYDIYFDFYKE
jgi:hypothetical protein